MSINEVTTRTNGTVTNYNDDPFMAFAGNGGMMGNASYLKYQKGHYYYGVDQIEMPLGTKLAVNMLSLKNGWIKWDNGMPAEKIFVIVAEGQKAPTRSELGDHDKRLWEAPNKDPWQEAVELEMVDGDGEKYIFNSSSKGGVNAIKKLTMEFAKERRSRPGLAPLVELGSDHYEHSKATFGKVLFPTFNIVGWVDEVTLQLVTEGKEPGDEQDDIPFDVAPTDAAKPPAEAKKPKQNQGKEYGARF